MGGSLAFAQIAKASRQESAGASLEGTVTIADPQGQVGDVPGVLVKLTGPSPAPDPQSGTTDAAEEEVRVEYQAPDHKTFVTESEKGSTLARDLVLKRLIESESETSAGRAHRDSSIKPANYELSVLGEQDVGRYHCLVVEAHPRRKDKDLFEGKIWVDTKDFAIVRIAGQPALKLSFWVTRADFVRQYQKIGDFWLPAKDETFVHVRLYGKKILTIDHREYAINDRAGGSTTDRTTENGTSEP